MPDPFGSILRNPTKPDSTKLEGWVTSVDPIRQVCRVRTTKGQNISGVLWDGGNNGRFGTDSCPGYGDRVVITYELGHPRISSTLPRVDRSEAFPTPIDTGTYQVDTGNYAPGEIDGTTISPNTPKDFMSGDRLFRSEGGGMLGILRGGSIIAKASRLAQIFITKYNDLVRIVGRNYEVFTDVMADVSANIRGRIYRFTGYADTYANGVIDSYKYAEYYGDTALGVYLKNQYVGANPSSFPAVTDVLRKYTISNGAGTNYMVQDLHATGQMTVTVLNGSSSSVIDHQVSGVTITSTSGTFSSATITPTSAVINFNGTALITVNSSGINCTFGTHFVRIDSSGTHLG